MAHISIHYTNRKSPAKVRAEFKYLPSCVILNIEEIGEDSFTLFFDGRDDAINFVDKINQALTGWLQENERGEG